MNMSDGSANKIASMFGMYELALRDFGSLGGAGAFLSHDRGAEFLHLSSLANSGRA